MQKLHYSIKINAPAQKVWDTMLGKGSYSEWTSAFMPGSYFEGSWDKGSKIRFLAANKDGEMEGMFSEIAENKPNEYISIRHLGIVTNGVEDTTSEEAKKWAGQAYENYALKEKNGITELTVDMDIVDEYKDEIDKAWPGALEKLKELAEK